MSRSMNRWHRADDFFPGALLIGFSERNVSQSCYCRMEDRRGTKNFSANIQRRRWTESNSEWSRDRLKRCALVTPSATVSLICRSCLARPGRNGTKMTVIKSDSFSRFVSSKLFDLDVETILSTWNHACCRVEFVAKSVKARSSVKPAWTETIPERRTTAQLLLTSRRTVRVRPSVVARTAHLSVAAFPSPPHSQDMRCWIVFFLVTSEDILERTPTPSHSPSLLLFPTRRCRFIFVVFVVAGRDVLGLVFDRMMQMITSSFFNEKIKEMASPKIDTL